MNLRPVLHQNIPFVLYYHVFQPFLTFLIRKYNSKNDGGQSKIRNYLLSFKVIQFTCAINICQLLHHLDYDQAIELDSVTTFENNNNNDNNDDNKTVGRIFMSLSCGDWRYISTWFKLKTKKIMPIEWLFYANELHNWNTITLPVICSRHVIPRSCRFFSFQMPFITLVFARCFFLYFLLILTFMQSRLWNSGSC